MSQLRRTIDTAILRRLCHILIIQVDSPEGTTKLLYLFDSLKLQFVEHHIYVIVANNQLATALGAK